MNIYFSCSITGGRQDEAIYTALVAALLARGCQVPTAHLARPDVLELEEVVDPVDVFQRDMGWIEACDALVAEVSTPSHGVGYEIAYALGLGKPVLCCYRQGARVSKIITGNCSPDLQVHPYPSIAEAVAGLQAFIDRVEMQRT